MPESDYNYYQEFYLPVTMGGGKIVIRNTRRKRFIRWLEGDEWVERYEPKRRWGYLLGKIVGAVWR